MIQAERKLSLCIRRNRLARRGKICPKHTWILDCDEREALCEESPRRHTDERTKFGHTNTQAHNTANTKARELCLQRHNENADKSDAKAEISAPTDKLQREESLHNGASLVPNLRHFAGRQQTSCCGPFVCPPAWPQNSEDSVQLPCLRAKRKCAPTLCAYPKV